MQIVLIQIVTTVFLWLTYNNNSLSLEKPPSPAHNKIGIS